MINKDNVKKRKQISIWVDPDLEQSFHEYCSRKRQRKSDVIEAMILQLLQEDKEISNTSMPEGVDDINQ